MLFQQDNARPHTAGLVREWFDKKGIETLGWPSQSPDMNIIEDVWGLMKFKLKGKVFEDIEEMWKEIKKCWKSISLQQIRNLYDSLPRRMEALERARGANTKS